MAVDAQVNYLGGINTYTDPFNTEDGIIVHSVNYDSFPLGAKKKRSGYGTYLGTPDAAQVNSLFSWTKNDGTTLYTYRASGSSLYYSIQGTGAWTICGNGTITNAAHVEAAVLDNTLIVCDGAGSTRHTTSGTSFTNTTLAPVAVSLTDYQNRIYASGTSSSLFYSTAGTATDWSTDSTSLSIPGPGKLGKIFKASDRVMTTKNSGIMHRWDGFNLVDLATKYGPSSQYSVAEVEDFRFYINQMGMYMTNSDKPKLISNPVQRQFYNDAGNGITGAQIKIAPGEVHKYDYFVSIGTVTDDFTTIQISNAILKYDFKKNEFLNYQFAHFPTAWHSYVDTTGVRQLIFGDANGQCYQLSGTATTDNGTAIETSMIVLLHANMPNIEKDWQFLDISTNPGCHAHVQVMNEHTVVGGNDWYRTAAKRWTEIGQLTNGRNIYRLPPDTHGQFLYVKIYDSSSTSGHNIYSIHYTYDPHPL